MPLTMHVTGQKKPTKIKGSIRVNLGACAKFFTWNGTEGTFLARLKVFSGSIGPPYLFVFEDSDPPDIAHPGTQKKKRFGTCL